MLAEPTLTAISGESAKFLAGGEFPVPSNAAACVGGLCPPPGIAFKPYGVALNFTPVVMADNRISIRVGTDVTEIDPQTSFNYTNPGGTTTAIPGTRVRRSETTVELPSGGVMMNAGMIQQVNKQALSGLPGLINLPILGALFRSATTSAGDGADDHGHALHRQAGGAASGEPPGRQLRRHARHPGRAARPVQPPLRQGRRRADRPHLPWPRRLHRRVVQ